MSDKRGTWVVVVRDVPGNEDQLIGPFHSGGKAGDVADSLRRDFAARGAQDVMQAFVQWVRPGIEHTDLRDELLAELEDAGYGFVPLEVRRGPGFNPQVGF